MLRRGGSKDLLAGIEPAPELARPDIVVKLHVSNYLTTLRTGTFSSCSRAAARSPNAIYSATATAAEAAASRACGCGARLPVTLRSR